MDDRLLGLTLSRDLGDARRQYARETQRGNQSRVSRGAYLDAAVWRGLDGRQRHLARVRAAAETREAAPIFSHWSAAAIHGLPIIGEWPERVHVVVGPTSGGRSRPGVVKHSLRLSDADVMEVEGMLVTTPARTVIDLAVAAKPISSVATADAALYADRFAQTLPLTTRDDLLSAWDSMQPFKGHKLALRIIEFADGRAETPIESVSRVNLHLIGAPAPDLQVEFRDYLGFIGFADFSWEEYRLIGEADGDQKYTDPKYRQGRSAEQVVVDEKKREDRFRAIERKVSRWDWAIAMSPSRLRAHLLHAGLPFPPRRPGR